MEFWVRLCRRGPRSRGSPKCSLVASGVLVRRGYEPWGVGEKAQNMEYVFMEMFLFNFNTKNLYRKT